MSTPALFIGGVWDGQRHDLNKRHLLYNVAKIPPLLKYQPGDAETAVVTAVPHEVYRRFLTVDNAAFYVQEELLNQPDPYKALLRELFKGYRNF